jgi:membrane dipeptidase
LYGAGWVKNGVKVKLLYLAVLFWVLLLGSATAQSDYKILHQQSLVVDTHTDVLLQVLRGADISKRLDYGHVDLIRLKEGGMDVQFFAVCPNPMLYGSGGMFEQSVRMIDILERIVNNNPDKISLTRTPSEIEQTVKDGKLAACIGVEGGTAIENDLDKLKTLYDRGARYLGLTWNDSPDWASCAKDESSEDYEGHRGLTEFGKDVVDWMNKHGMIVDVSHSGEKTFWDVIEVSKKPIIASHSCAYKLCSHYRNLKDDQIKAIGQNNGVIFINFYPGYLINGFNRKYYSLRKSSQALMDSMKQVYGDDHLGYRSYRNRYLIEQAHDFRPDIGVIVDHMDYIISLIGDDHIGIGSDFDGISVVPSGIDDVSKMPEITRMMLQRGYSTERIRKILGGNFMRVFREVSVQ